MRPHQLVLRNAKMDFPAGSLTFVIGKSGSGKSTVGQLLTRLYQVSEGEVTLDGHTFRTMEPDWIRRNVLLVEQGSVLFEETIAKNIAYGRRDHELVSDDDIESAIRFAALESMIGDMPNGIDTVIGARGSTLSGGQRQRMALARAKIRDPPVLILDESTSALDYINRSHIMDAIRDWRRGKTTIIITHDISQILLQDFVYVLEGGHVVQEGYRETISAIAGSPFQGFLDERPAPHASEEESGTTVIPKPKQKPRPLSILSPLSRQQSPTGDSLELVDPLEMYLAERKEEWESSIVPTVFTNRIGSRAQRDSMRASTVISPLLRVNSCHSRSESPVTVPRSSDDHLVKSNVSGVMDLIPGFVDRAGERARETRRLSRITERSRRTSNTSSAPLNRRSFSGSNAYEMAVIPEGSKGPKDYQTDSDEAKSKTKESLDVLSLRSILGTIWTNLLWFDRMLLLNAFFWLVVYAVSTPVFSFVFSKLLATLFLVADREHKAMVYSLSVLAIAITDSSASFIYTSQLQIIGQIWVNGIRVEAFRRILDQPRQFFDKEENAVSRMTEVLDSRAEVMQTILGRFVPAVMLSSIMMSVAIGWSMIASWKLTLVGLAATPILWMISRAFDAVERKMAKSVQDKVETVSNVFSETFTSIRTVKTLTLEDHFRKKFSAENRVLMTAAVKRAICSGVCFGMAEGSIVYLTALLFHWGAVLVSKGTSFSSILTVFTELLFGLSAVQNILTFIPQMSASRDAATRLLRLASLPEESYEHSGNTRVTSVGDINCHQLNFHYPGKPQQQILNGLSLSIPTGSCVSLVGSSGSGKSTIASLLLNLYTPDPPPPYSRVPPVTLSGRDMKHIHTPTLRNLITIVSQTPFLFPTSIEENITYGLRSGSLYKNMISVRAAATAAAVDDFIMSLPDGYATVVGDGGMGLSGGQAQRISIARALVRRPSVLILDEATSALDVESAAIIRDSILKLTMNARKRAKSDTWQSSLGSSRSGARSSEGLTVIIITHAKEMMSMADKIIMLHRGRLIEQGGYEELLRKKGPFYQLLNGEEWKRESQSISRRSMMLMNGVKGVNPSP